MQPVRLFARHISIGQTPSLLKRYLIIVDAIICLLFSYRQYAGFQKGRK